MINQEELRERCKFLKYERNINYKDIAKAIGMSENSFYNFISGRKVNIGYRHKWLLENYLKEEERKCI